MSIAGYLHEFAVRCGPVLGQKVETSITLRFRGLAVRAASSTAASGRCDQVEARTGVGPCIDAMESGEIQNVPSVADAEQWPPWQGAAVSEGFVTTVALPAQVVADMQIALNLYARSPMEWTEELLKRLNGYAELAAASVRLHLDHAVASDGLEANPPSDAQVVAQAIGAIMHLNQCGVDDAQALIEQAAQSREVSQREVARTILSALVPDSGI